MKFFFDNCVAPRFAEAINALIEQEGHSAVHLIRDFAPDTPDVKWLTALGKEGDWIIISGDLRITRNKHERAAWLETNLTAFFLTSGWQNLTFWDQAWKLIQRWPSIMDQANRVAPGAGFQIKPGSVRFEQVRLR